MARVSRFCMCHFISLSYAGTAAIYFLSFPVTRIVISGYQRTCGHRGGISLFAVYAKALSWETICEATFRQKPSVLSLGGDPGLEVESREPEMLG